MGRRWVREKPWWKYHYASTYANGPYVTKVSKVHSPKKNSMPKRSNSMPVTPRGTPKRGRQPVRGNSTSSRSRSLSRMSTGTRSSRSRSRVSFASSAASSASNSSTRSKSHKLSKGKSTKRLMKKKIVRYTINGINKTIEGGKTLAATDVLWIGHSTWAPTQIQRMVYSAVFQKCFVAAGIMRPNQLAENAFVAPSASLIRIDYQISPTATVSNVSYTTTGTDSFKDFIDWFTSSARPWHSTLDQDQEFLFQKCLVQQAGATTGPKYPTKEFNLELMKVKLFAKSSMKIQNRTQSAGVEGPDYTDVIDDSPLIGRSYSGNGNTLKGSAEPTGDLIAEANLGYMQGNDSVPELHTSRKEPPQPTNFKNVKFSGKVTMEPGEIKTSVLTSSYSHYLNTWVRVMRPGVQQPNSGATLALTTGLRRSEGKFRVFALEKQLAITADARSINCAFEVNLEMSAQCTMSKKGVGLLKEFIKYEI